MAAATTLARTALVFTVILFTAATLPAQTPGGGHVPEKEKPKTDTGSVPKATRSTSVDRIDGRWWTTGNDFGASEVVFTQNGSQIDGEIHYVDGRTGNIQGTFTNKRLKFTFSNSSGETGSGWLELSWINFLGGPCTSAKHFATSTTNAGSFRQPR